jgi:ferredoxin-thioredoxin reductase catalytic subunit
MISEERIRETYERLKIEAEASAYHLNPDVPFTMSLVEGLLINEERYGYWACPCRLAEGIKLNDLDIICPCDYRDADVDEYGACYCALYVSQEVLDGKAELRPVPERRPPVPRQLLQKEAGAPAQLEEGMPVWRCRVCGYLCARDQPPAVCPICKAKKDRFERFGFGKAG